MTTETTTRPAPTPEDVIGWLEAEFPGWAMKVDATASWDGAPRALWTAERDGHHPQSELSAAKLHSRLSDYLERERRRLALSEGGRQVIAAGGGTAAGG